MRIIQVYDPISNKDAVPEFLVTSHSADIDILTFMSEENAMERAKELAESYPGHTFLVFALVAETRGRTVDVEVRRVAE